MGTNETGTKQRKQQETDDLKSRIRKLRNEGYTYRKIAQLEHVSIAQISRILNEPSGDETETKPQTTEGDLGEEASEVFELLEKGNPLSKIVINLKMSPHRVEELNEMWIRLKKKDVNQPIVLERIQELDEVLVWHMDIKHKELEALQTQTEETGEYRMKYCSNINERGFCTRWTWKDTDGISYYRKPNGLRCAFCHNFERAMY